MNIYYLYRHIDLQNNIPFYIGIGKNDKYFYYSRSKDKIARSKEWKEYVYSINSNYEIEILFETSDCSLIVSKEREFIKLYGRIDLETGTLVNKDGGKGKGEVSKKSLENMIRKQKCKKVIVYNSKGEKIGIFDRAMSASISTGVSYLSVKQCLMKKHLQSKGFRFLKEEEEVEYLTPLEYKPFNRNINIQCKNIKTGEILTFNNLTEASRNLNIPESTIGNNLNGTTKLARKKYKFEYLKEKGII